MWYTIRVSGSADNAQALFIVLAAVRVLYEFWRKKVLDIFL